MTRLFVGNTIFFSGRYSNRRAYIARWLRPWQKKSKGLTLQEIKAELGADDGGSLTKVLTNLCNCDFVRKYVVYGKKNKGALYQLTDMFSLFHLKFVGSRTGFDSNYCSNLSEAKRNSWAGFAFERVCLHHIDQIRHKLSIKGVLTNVCSWNSPRQTDADGTEWDGAQIDLILVRGDHVSTLCEMKYSQSEFVVTRDYEERIRERNATFVHFTKTRDAIQTVLVTTYGLKSNQYSGVFLRHRHHGRPLPCGIELPATAAHDGALPVVVSLRNFH